MALVVELVTSVAVQVRDVSEYCENYCEISLLPLYRWLSAASPSAWRSGRSWSPATTVSRPPPLGWGQQSWQPSRYHQKRCWTKINILIPIGKIFTATLCVRAGAAAGGAAVAGPAAAAGAARHPQHVPLHRHPHRAVMSHVLVL